jgi:hypothetical protein
MTAIVNETVSVKKKPSGRRVIFASAFGNALEFFDFGVYNFFVVYISTLFFPPRYHAGAVRLSSNTMDCVAKYCAKPPKIATPML